MKERIVVMLESKHHDTNSKNIAAIDAKDFLEASHLLDARLKHPFRGEEIEDRKIEIVFDFRDLVRNPNWIEKSTSIRGRELIEFENKHVRNLLAVFEKSTKDVLKDNEGRIVTTFCLEGVSFYQ